MSGARGPLALRVAAGLLTALWLLAAATRKLNYDEALAIRAGWLDLGPPPHGEPALTMPLTLLLGALARPLGDPLAVVVGLRLAAATATLALLWGLARRAAGPAAALAVVLVLLCQVAFVHDLELRYDLALTLGALAGCWALARPGPRTGWVVGAVLGWLAAHHLKGVYWAGALGAVAVLRLGPRALPALLGGALGALAAWGALATALGLGPRLVEVLTTFGAIGGGAAARTGVVEALGPALTREAGWGGVMLAGVALWARGLRRDDPALPAALLATALAVFPLLHPHPWPYMLAPVATLLAVPAAAGLWRLTQREGGLGRLAGVLALAMAAQALVGGSPLLAHGRSLAQGHGDQVRALRALRTLASPGDRVADPAGLAWFLPPCHPQWYLDGLFQPEAAAGRWMAGDGGWGQPPCAWLVVSTRIDGLPPGRAAVVPAYQDLGGGLRHLGPLAPVDDAGRAALEGLGPPRVLDGFWGGEVAAAP